MAPRRVLLLALRGYRIFFSPWLGGACRFEPTCSVYAQGAIERHGAAVGTAWVAWRLLRCHPFCPGGCDPVPDRPLPVFTQLIRRPGGSRPQRAESALGMTPLAAADPPTGKTQA